MDERYRLNLDRVVRDKVWSEPASPAATGAGSLTGAGTATYLAKWTGGTMLGDSMIIDSIAGDVATLDATLTAGRTYTLSDVAGTFALGAGTLTAATGSDVTIAAHLHPITNTADGATNHSTILSSSAAGALTLDDYFTIDGGTVGISGNELLTFNAAGTITVTGADFDLDGRKLILDPDGDTYLYASGDDIVDLVLNGLSGTFAIRINGVLDFSFTEDSFNILSGSYITMADDTWIGLGAAAGRFVFDSTPSPDQIDITSADLNFATASHGIIHTDGVTAGELLRADGTRYVPTGWYLMGTAAQTYTLGTSGGTVSTSPGTLSASTVNSTTGAGVHTHAITSSDDGAANHNTLLESDGSGRITMDDYFTIDGGSFGVSGNELLVVDTAGYFEFTGSDVGINTGGAPGHPLTIALSGDYLSIVDSGDSDNDRVRLGESAGNGGYLTLYDDSEAVGALIRSYASADVQAYFNAGGVSIGSTSAPRTNYGLDVASGSLSAVFGADSNAFGTRTNSTSKRMRVGCYHYTNAQEPMAIIYANADSALNSLFIGGGTSLMNAATTIRLYTAANVTTTTGTERMRIESDGKIGMNGTTSPSTALDIGGGAMEYEEMSAPGAGAANTVRTYAVDDGGVSTFGIVNSTGDTVTLNDDALKTTEESFDISVDGENLIEIQEGTPDYVRILNDQPIQFTKVSASSASITICAGGSVSAGVVYNAMVEDTTTNTVQNNNGFISSASSVDLFNDGAGNEYALTLGAGGGLTMTRSAGAHTFNVFLSTFWI